MKLIWHAMIFFIQKMHENVKIEEYSLELSWIIKKVNQGVSDIHES